MDGNLQDYRPTSAEAIRRQLEPFRESDFYRVYWQVDRGDVREPGSENVGMGESRQSESRWLTAEPPGAKIRPGGGVTTG